MVVHDAINDRMTCADGLNEGKIIELVLHLGKMNDKTNNIRSWKRRRGIMGEREKSAIVRPIRAKEICGINLEHRKTP